MGTILLEDKYFIPRELICEPDNYKYLLEEGLYEQDAFFSWNRQVAFKQKTEVLAAIENFLLQEFSLKN